VNQFARIVSEIAEARRPAAERAYERLREAAKHGGQLNVSDHDLVAAISQAVWNHELITAQYGLNELQTRTAADAVLQHERRVV
jgi:hypothetical protein